MTNTSETDQQAVFNSLKDKPPDVWITYLRQNEDGEQTPGLSFDLIIHYAYSKAKEHKSLEWAEVATRAAELLGVSRDGDVWRAMRIRSEFISEMGSRAGHFVLDKEIVQRWINDALRRPLQEVKDEAAIVCEQLSIAKELSAENRKQLLGRLRELRGIKRRLFVAKMIIDSGEVVTPSLYEWLEIREQLP